MLPSYNGSRKVPNLTALLAMLLAQHDVPVLVHGPAHDPTRVTTAEIFRDLGLTCAEDADDIAAAWQRREPAFIRTEALCPPLARLLAVRSVVGLRNSGHTVAKLLGGCGSAPTLRVVNYTHPDYGTLLAGFLAATGADAVLMRGTEGEPVADARRQQRLDVYLGGVLQPELSGAGTGRRAVAGIGAARRQRRDDDGEPNPGNRQRRDAGAAADRDADGMPAAHARGARRRRSPEAPEAATAAQ